MEDVAVLRALGLTEYGAKAYVGLVGLGTAGATAVAEAAQVPRTRVYSVLQEIIRKGWAHDEGGRPKRYRPADPRDRIAAARQALLTDVERTETNLSALFEQDGVQFGGPMWVLHGAEAVQKRLARMARAAKNELFVGLAFPIPGDDGFMSRLATAAARGVHVRAVVPPPLLETMTRLRDIGVDARPGFAPFRVHFADDASALLCFKEETVTTPRFKAIWNPHAEMVAQLRTVADQLWAASGTTGSALNRDLVE